MKREHWLKIWPSFFEAVATGAKPFEVRSTRDRDFAVGDVLFLREWEPDGGRVFEHQGYTNRAIRAAVTYVMPGGRFGIDASTAVLGLGEVAVGMQYDDGEFYPQTVSALGEQRAPDAGETPA